MTPLMFAELLLTVGADLTMKLIDVWNRPAMPPELAREICAAKKSYDARRTEVVGAPLPKS